MKFCYLDESGMGDEPILVMAGIVVDAGRMHVTKKDWDELLEQLSKIAKKPINEFHTRNLYNGNGPWRNVDGPIRSAIIDFVLDWIEERKHKVTFSAINKKCFEDLKNDNGKLDFLYSPWYASAVHSILTLQRANQKHKKTKGHTVLIFDKEAKEENRLTEFVFSTPEWTGSYYGKQEKSLPLDQIIDVPFFVDSEKALLIQVADLVSYILRNYAEIAEGMKTEKYSGEKNKLSEWTNKIVRLSLPRATRYSNKSRCEIGQLFWDLAPPSLRR